MTVLLSTHTVSLGERVELSACGCDHQLSQHQQSYCVTFTQWLSRYLPYKNKKHDSHTAIFYQQELQQILYSMLIFFFFRKVVNWHMSNFDCNEFLSVCALCFAQPSVMIFLFSNDLKFIHTLEHNVYFYWPILFYFKRNVQGYFDEGFVMIHEIVEIIKER